MNGEHRIWVNELVAAAEIVLGLPRGAIASERRTRALVAARHAVCWIAHKRLNRTLSEIGRVLRLDHTSVLNGVRRSEERAAEGGGPSEAEIEAILEIAARMVAGRGAAVTLSAPPTSTSPEPAAPAQDSEPAADPAPGAVPRDWWEENNARFVAAMRAAHPDRETPLRMGNGAP